MLSTRHFLIALAVLLLPSPFLRSIPQQFGGEKPVEVPPDGPITLKPGEGVTVGFEIKHGKMVNFVVLPPGSERKEKTLHLSLTREGGGASKLGPPTQINDTLNIECSEKRPIAARAEYTLLAGGKLQRTRLNAKDGSVSKSFRWGITQIVISELELPKP